MLDGTEPIATCRATHLRLWRIDGVRRSCNRETKVVPNGIRQFAWSIKQGVIPAERLTHATLLVLREGKHVQRICVVRRELQRFTIQARNLRVITRKLRA